jgi:16S rRNA pseudouridine516 synthase
MWPAISLAGRDRREDKPCPPAQMQAKGARTVALPLTEGRHHQVRRMFAAAGNHVEALHRSRFGPLVPDALMEGTWRPLTGTEIAALRA